MKRLIIVVLCVTLTSAALLRSFPIATDVKVGIGPAVNQVVGINHFTLAASNKKAKTKILSLDNPCALIYGSLTFHAFDFLFSKLIVVNVRGQNGYFTSNSSEQESPFTVQANLDGLINTNIFAIALLEGIEWDILDNLSLLAAPGYLHVQGERFIEFSGTTASAHTKSTFNAGGFQVGGKIKPSEETALKASYYFFLGPLSAQILNSPGTIITLFATPLFMFNGVAIEYDYQIREDCSVFLLGGWSVSQNIKKLDVKSPLSVNALMRHQSVPLFRSQFLSLIIGLQWKF